MTTIHSKVNYIYIKVVKGSTALILFRYHALKSICYPHSLVSEVQKLIKIDQQSFLT